MYHCRSNIPFDKEELNAILKFGAAELFGEVGGDGAGDKALQEMDIDDILRRAETQVAVEDSCSVADELLSQVRVSPQMGVAWCILAFLQFKVATFALDEEVGGANVPLATPTEEKALLLSPTLQSEDKRPQGEQRSWDEIIPAAMLEQVEEVERQKEELQLYLPPRQRTVQVRKWTVAMLAPFHLFLPTSRTTARTSSQQQWQLMAGVMAGGPEVEAEGGERGLGGGRRQVPQLTPLTGLQ